MELADYGELKRRAIRLFRGLDLPDLLRVAAFPRGAVASPRRSSQPSEPHGAAAMRESTNTCALDKPVFACVVESIRRSCRTIQRNASRER